MNTSVCITFIRVYCGTLITTVLVDGTHVTDTFVHKATCTGMFRHTILLGFFLLNSMHIHVQYMYMHTQYMYVHVQHMYIYI